jgi:hypothetical protein
MYIASMFLTVFGLFIFSAAFFIIQSISLSSYANCGSSIFFSNTCYNKDYRWIHYVFIAFGVVLVVSSIIYEIVLSTFYAYGNRSATSIVTQPTAPVYYNNQPMSVNPQLQYSNPNQTNLYPNNFSY